MLALPHVSLLELAIPLRVFASARDAHGDALYDVRTLAPRSRTVRTAEGVDLKVTHVGAAVTTADVLVVPPSAAAKTIMDGGRLPAAVTRVLLSAPPTARLASLCTGAFVLAAAGLLDGHGATTHWRHAARLQQLFPAVRVDASALTVDAGRVLTSGGVTAAIDLCLHMIATDHGTPVARQVARQCLVPLAREGDQALYADREDHPEPVADTTAATRRWAADRLHERLSLADLAAHAGMSVRTFTRRFRSETGRAPARWVLDQRITLACRLLERTDMPVARVARQSGLGTAASLRHHLNGVAGVAPLAYRRALSPSPEAEAAAATGRGQDRGKSVV